MLRSNLDLQDAWQLVVVLHDGALLGQLQDPVGSARWLTRSPVRTGRPMQPMR